MRQRPGYTLLEVLLAMAMAILLLAAVYSAIGYQIRHAQAGRDLIDQATLARSLIDRISNDVLAAAALSDPGRYRTQQQKQSGSGSGGGAGGSGMSGAGGAGGAAAGGAGASGSGTGGAGGTSGGASGASGSASTPGVAVILPLGVMGDSSSLRLFIGRYPNEMWPANSNDQPPLMSDLRRISYWGGSGGLCRQEIKVVTSQDALNMSIPTDDNGQNLLAPEVHSLEFSYFDGTNWNDTWDSTMLGPDNVTPVGSPRAISIKIGVPAPGEKGKDPKLKYYRQVVVISTANGPTYLANGQVNQGGLTTTGQSATTGSTTGMGSATPSGN
jgi:type II secretory pathway pseudopilin PulG